MTFFLHPLWNSRWVKIAVCGCLGALAFVSAYDFAWQPHDTFEAALLVMLFAALWPILTASLDWVWGRICRVPVEWASLFRLQIALSALSLPISLLIFQLSQFYASWSYATSLSLLLAGATLTLWSQFLWSRYYDGKNVRRMLTFLVSSGCCMATLALWIAANSRPLVLAAQDWREERAGRVRIFYTADSFTQIEGAKTRAQKVNSILSRVEKTLELPPIDAPINFFFFPDQTAFDAFVADDAFVGLAGRKGLVMVDSDWETARATVAHELSHVVVARQWGTNCRTVLDEGTAVWLENKIARGDDSTPPERQKNLKTTDLASDEGFAPDDENEIYSHYAHAGWLAKTTIERDGISKWKRFLQVSRASFLVRASETEEEAAQDLQRDFRAVYGRELP